MDKKDNSNILVAVIITLMVIIVALVGVGAYLLGTKSAPVVVGGTNLEGVEITIIDDKRCNDCPTDELMTQLKAIPQLGTAKFEQKDFADEGVKELLEENNINFLPAVITNNNNIPGLSEYLVAINDGKYSLQVGAKFDPFKERSANGFLLADKSELDTVLDDAIIKGNPDAQITWIEYSDLDCPACKALYQYGAPKELPEKYGDKINKSFQHFPLDSIHPLARKKAESIECIASLGNEQDLYTLIDKNFYEGLSLEQLEDEAETLGVNVDDYKKCVEDKTFAAKVEKDLQDGLKIFGVNSTPTSVFINNETLEYEIVSGASASDRFIPIIDKLLGE